MYRQEIACDDSVFRKIQFYFEEQETWDSKSYEKNLELKNLIIWSGHKNIFEDSIKCKGFLKLFKNLIAQEGRLHFKEIESSSNKDIAVARLTTSKILHSQRSFAKEMLNNEIEAVNISQFNTPSDKSALFCIKRKITVKRNDFFNFEKTFEPYLAETKHIKINDRYLPKKISIYNLERILHLCKKLQSIEISTYFNESEISKIDFENRIVKSFSITPTFNKYAEHIRTIKSDNFEISIDPGLDFVNKDFIAERNKVVIHIERL